MSIIRKLIGHTSIYVSAEVIITAAGFISFPIITRFLSQSEYGAMTLIGILITTIEGLSGLGLNHSSQRFYWDYEKENKGSSFITTLFLGSAFLGILGTFCSLLLMKLLSVFHIIPGNLENILYIASLLIFIRITTKIVGSTYRAKEQPVFYSVFAVLSKYVALGLVVLFLVHAVWGLFGYYFGLVVGEVVVLVVFLFFFWKRGEVVASEFSPTILKRTVVYGFPLIFSGLATGLMSGSDRYLIGYFLTLSDVAIYSVPYNVCGYLMGILLSGFQFGFIPIIMAEWSKKNIDQTHIEMQRVVRLYCLVAFPIVAGLSILGRDVIVLLASEKYAEASNILPYIATSSMVSGLCGPMMIGLWFLNETKTVAVLTLQAAGVNFLLNLVLIPWIGLQGAAISTLFSYALLLVMGTRKSSALFKIKIPWKPISIYFMSTIIMYGLLKALLETYPETNLVVQVAVGTGIYMISVYAFDARLRDKLNAQIGGGR